MSQPAPTSDTHTSPARRPQFATVREINAACRAAAQGRGAGVRVSQGSGALQIARARRVGAAVQVHLVATGRWVPCALADIFTLA